MGKLLIWTGLLGVSILSHAQVQPDPAFGTDGKVQVNAAWFEEIKFLGVDAEDRIYPVSQVLTPTDDGADYSIFFMRHSANGLADSPYANGGTTWDFPGFNLSFIEDAAITANDELLLLGYGQTWEGGGNQPFCLSRFDVFGNPDMQFGNNGTLELSFMGPVNDPGCMLVEGSGIWLGGDSFDTNYVHKEVPVVAHLLNSGEPDTGFGISGKIAIDFAAGQTIPLELMQGDEFRHDDGGIVHDILRLDNGQLLVSGARFGTLTFYGFAARIFENGVLDTTFANNGFLSYELGSGYNNYFLKAHELDNGNLLFNVHSDGGLPNDMYLAKFTASGELLLPGAIDVVEDYTSDALLIGNQLLMCGRSIDPANMAVGYSSDFFAVHAVNTTSLEPDNGFNGTGVWLESFSTLKSAAYTVAQQSNGRLLLAGFSESATDNDYSDQAIVGLAGATSVDHDTHGVMLYVYPNPSANKVFVKVDQYPVFVEVYDVTGQGIIKELIVDEQDYIDVHSWMPGLYLIFTPHLPAVRVLVN